MLLVSDAFAADALMSAAASSLSTCSSSNGSVLATAGGDLEDAVAFVAFVAFASASSRAFSMTAAAYGWPAVCTAKPIAAAHNRPKIEA